MGFQQVFSGNTIYPSDPTYLALALTEDETLEWPVEQAITGLVVAAIIDVTPDAAGRTITMPDAQLVSTGYVSTFYNAGSDTYTVLDSDGNTIMTVASGEAWNLYLRDNSTAAGLWRIFQMGAGTSSANAAALAGAGLVAFSSTLNEEMEIFERSSNYAIVNADRAKVVVWTGGVGALTLPDPATVGANWFVSLKNDGSGSVTVTPSAGTIDDSSNLVLGTLESCFVVSDGTNYLTVGFGQSNNSVFDFISIPVPGTGDFTLAGAQLNRVAYEFTGILTGNRNIIVPASIQQYWVTNSTTGAFTLTVKTALGSGVIVAANTRSILYCDGTDVVNADDASSISFPITATQGGTGLTSYNQGDILYASAANTLSALAKSGTATRYLTNTGSANSPAWGQVNLANGVTGILPGNNLITSGTFSLDITSGSTSTGAQTASYTIIGNICILRLPVVVSGTGTAVNFQIGFLPAAIIPTVTSIVPCFAGDNGLGRVAALAIVTASATAIALCKITPANGNYDPNGWTASGTRTIPASFTLVYPLS